METIISKIPKKVPPPGFISAFSLTLYIKSLLFISSSGVNCIFLTILYAIYICFWLYLPLASFPCLHPFFLHLHTVFQMSLQGYFRPEKFTICSHFMYALKLCTPFNICPKHAKKYRNSSSELRYVFLINRLYNCQNIPECKLSVCPCRPSLM